MLLDSTPPFDGDVPDGGYRWWYLDGISDCRRYSLVVIAFIGSVFSPYYYRAKNRGRGEARNFCAINVASYGPSAGAWAMTERGSQQLATSPTRFQVGRSRLELSADRLRVSVDERTMPWFRTLRGKVSISADCASSKVFFLDEGRQHQWQPIAPIARIEVDLEHPNIRWTGDAYVDTNFGTRPLEDDFRSWHWSCARKAEGSNIYYDALQRDGRRNSIALSVNPRNEVREIAVPPRIPLSGTSWGIARVAQHGNASRVIETLENTPFYARSVLATNAEPGADLAIHESLSLERFRRGWVRMLLPFRMPRIT